MSNDMERTLRDKLGSLGDIMHRLQHENEEYKRFNTEIKKELMNKQDVVVELQDTNKSLSNQVKECEHSHW